MVPDVPAGVEKYLNPSAKDHGVDGQVLLFPYPKSPSAARLFMASDLANLDTKRPVNVGFPKVWEKSHQAIVDIWTASGVTFQTSFTPLN